MNIGLVISAVSPSGLVLHMDGIALPPLAESVTPVGAIVEGRLEGMVLHVCNIDPSSPEGTLPHISKIGTVSTAGTGRLLVELI